MTRRRGSGSAASKWKFKDNARKICEQIMRACDRNFDIRDKPARLDEDGNVLEPARLDYTAHAWTIEKTKGEIYDLAFLILYHVETADSIYPHYKSELEERRIEQDKAIGACFSLKKALTITLSALNVKATKYADLVKPINEEINVIRGWRKSDGARFSERAR